MSDAPVELGDLSDLADGQLRVFPQLGEHGIVVCRVAGALYAVQDNCSHAEARLSEGRLRGTMLICPRHGAAFDVRDGSHQGPPAWTGIACYPVSEEAGVVRVALASGADRDTRNRDVGGRFDVR